MSMQTWLVGRQKRGTVCFTGQLKGTQGLRQIYHCTFKVSCYGD